MPRRTSSKRRNGGNYTLQEHPQQRVSRSQEEGNLICCSFCRTLIEMSEQKTLAFCRFVFQRCWSRFYSIMIWFVWVDSFGNIYIRTKVHSVAWNCTGTKLASGSVDQTARVWYIEPHGHVRFLIPLELWYFPLNWILFIFFFLVFEQLNLAQLHSRFYVLLCIELTEEVI